MIHLVHVVEKKFRIIFSINTFIWGTLQWRVETFKLCMLLRVYMDKIRVYIATGKSRKIIRDARIAEKKGQVVDWQKVLEDSHEARAIGKENQVRAVGESK